MKSSSIIWCSTVRQRWSSLKNAISIGVQPKDRLDHRKSKDLKHSKSKDSTTNQVDMVSIGNNLHRSWKRTQLYTKEIPQVQKVMEWIVWQKISRLCTMGL